MKRHTSNVNEMNPKGCAAFDGAAWLRRDVVIPQTVGGGMLIK
jgi:hypothetical protein